MSQHIVIPIGMMILYVTIYIHIRLCTFIELYTIPMSLTSVKTDMHAVASTYNLDDLNLTNIGRFFITLTFYKGIISLIEEKKKYI